MPASPIAPPPPAVVDVKLMGVVNVTPDSFSDGGLYLDAGAAIAHGEVLAAEGATILDVGGESTRPGAAAVTGEEELRRVEPVAAALSEVATVSIDTSKATVAAAALDAGAAIVNDVTALRGDPEMAGLVAERGVPVVLMHMAGDPRTMQIDPHYADVVAEVRDFLAERLAFAVEAGIAEEKIWLDPGIGFGKTAAHNFELLRGLPELADLGRPLVVGTSRKSFLGRADGSDAANRLGGTIATSVLAALSGAAVLRVHDVREMSQAMSVVDAVISA